VTGLARSDPEIAALLRRERARQNETIQPIPSQSLAGEAILANRNLIAYDERPALVTSGIRVGTPVVSFRGFGPAEIDDVADVMLAVLGRPTDKSAWENARSRVSTLCQRFPLYGQAAAEA
jgi:glycine hydroxymethyltransferase